MQNTQTPFLAAAQNQINPLNFLEKKSDIIPTWTDIEQFAQHQKPSRLSALYFFFEFVIYAFYVSILVASSMQDRVVPNGYAFTQSVTKTMATDAMGAVVNMKDAVAYIRQIIVPQYIKGLLSWNNNYTSQTLVQAFGGSTLLTTLRFRQHRSVVGCDRPSYLNKVGPCYRSSEESDWYSTTPFTPVGGSKTFPFVTGSQTCSGTVYGTKQYTLSQLCPGESMKGATQATYPSGGYIVDVDFKNLNKKLASLASSGAFIADADINSLVYDITSFLENDRWLDASTRVLLVEFAIMMNNLDEPQFASPTLMIEFTTEGYVLPTFTMIPFKLNLSETQLSLAVLIVACILLAISIIKVIVSFVRTTPCVQCLIDEYEEDLQDTPWYKCSECNSMYDRFALKECPKCERMADEWAHVCPYKGNLLHANMFGPLFNFAFVLTIYLVRQTVRSALQERVDILQDFIANAPDDIPAPFLDFGSLQKSMGDVSSIAAGNIIWACGGIYAYVRHFEIFGKFLRLFESGAVSIAQFLLAFTIPFAGFVLAFHITFGTRTPGFQYPGQCLVSTFRLALAQFSFADLHSEMSWFTTLLYVTHGIIVFLTMLNVFIAIIGFAYEEAGAVKKPRTRISDSFLLLFGFGKKKIPPALQPPGVAGVNAPPPEDEKGEIFDNPETKEIDLVVNRLREVQTCLYNINARKGKPGERFFAPDGSPSMYGYPSFPNVSQQRNYYGGLRY
eukprot:PhF_6_TR36130/c0_g1_i1/m.52450